MGLTANSLTTWARLKDELGLSDNTYQSRGEDFIAEVSDEIASICGRVFQRASGIVENVVPGDYKLLLARPPILTITTITEDGEAVDAEDYEVLDAGAGIVVREDGWDKDYRDTAEHPDEQEATVAVTYAGGFVPPGTTWAASTFFHAGSFAKPTAATNLNVFVAGGNGSTGSGSEPSWAASVGDTVVDSGITWTNVGPRTLPRGLERVALNGAVVLWRGRGQRRDLVSETVGAASQTFARQEEREHPFFTKDDLRVLARYTLPRVY